MLTPEQFDQARIELKKAVHRDLDALDDLRNLISELGRPTRIQSRRATSIALVGTDGGYNQTTVNPFLAQLMRVVDSSNKQYCLEVVSSNTSMEDLNKFHMLPSNSGEPSPIKELIDALGVSNLMDLSPVFKSTGDQRSNSWFQVYRQITEWAVLFKLIKIPYGSDTVIVWDGPLRTKVFPPDIFANLSSLLKRSIQEQEETRNRKIYLVGITRRSKILERYRLPMALEGVMRQSYPCYVLLTGKVLKDAVKWIEYLSPTERLTLPIEQRSQETQDVYSMGQMYFVKFGGRPTDSVWAVDVLESQNKFASTIFGYLLEDAKDGFPIPLFPQCLQDAQANASFGDFDADLFSYEFGRNLRQSLGSRSDVVDELELQNADSAMRK